MRKIIVDIDNTLWHFAPVFYEKLLKVNPNIPPVEEWKDWDFWQGYISKKELYKAVDEIHLNQHIYDVFEDAKDFLEFIKYELNLHIIIASHRREESRPSTIFWLGKHKLVYDELHLSNNKTVLFEDKSIIKICDDAPDIIEKAKQHNLKVFGLKFPWNRQYHDILYDSLRDIKNIINHNIEER